MPSRRCSGTVDQEQSAERPERLAAEALFALLVDHDDALAGVGDFGCGDEAREAAADHDYIRIICHRVIPPALARLKPAAFAAVNGKRHVRSGRSQQGFVNLFQFGTFPAAGCSVPATLDLNLFGAVAGHLDKIPIRQHAGETPCITQGARVRRVWTGAGYEVRDRIARGGAPAGGDGRQPGGGSHRRRPRRPDRHLRRQVSGPAYLGRDR